MFFFFLPPNLDQNSPFDTEHMSLQLTLCTVPGNYFLSKLSANLYLTVLALPSVVSSNV